MICFSRFLPKTDVYKRQGIACDKKEWANPLAGVICVAPGSGCFCLLYTSASGGQSQMNFDGNFFPDFSNFDNLVLASSIFLFYAGMEMGGIHVKDIENPAKNYPKAVFIGAAITVIIFVLAGVLTWVAGPSKGIFAVGKAGYLPPFFQKTNANGVQKNILLVQGLAVTLLKMCIRDRLACCTRLVTYTVKIGNIIIPRAASTTDSIFPVGVTA